VTVAFAVELPPRGRFHRGKAFAVVEEVLRQPFACVVNLRALRLKAFAYVLVQAGAVFFGPFSYFPDDCRGY
jgi:hypothetical protein